MNIQEFLMSFVMQTLASGLSLSIVVWLFKEWLSIRLKASINHEYELKMETYKTQQKMDLEQSILDMRTLVAREATFYSSAHASFAEGQKASMDRKLNAIDRLWLSILKLRTTLPPILGFMDFLSEDEFKGAKEHPTFRELSEELSLTKITEYMNQSIEEVRPYVGEYTWSVFFCYQAIMLRILFLIQLGRTDAEKLEWHKDAGIRQLTDAVLTPEETQQFQKVTFGKRLWLSQKLEAKILASAQKIISGESFGAESFEQARRIQEVISSSAISANRQEVKN